MDLFLSDRWVRIASLIKLRKETKSGLASQHAGEESQSVSPRMSFQKTLQGSACHAANARSPADNPDNVGIRRHSGLSSGSRLNRLDLDQQSRRVLDDLAHTIEKRDCFAAVDDAMIIRERHVH